MKRLSSVNETYLKVQTLMIYFKAKKEGRDVMDVFDREVSPEGLGIFIRSFGPFKEEWRKNFNIRLGDAADFARNKGILLNVDSKT